MPDARDLANRFGYHRPTTEEQQRLHENVRANVAALGSWLNAYLPESRELSTALSKLEEAMFWANAAAARMDSAGGRRTPVAAGE